MSVYPKRIKLARSTADELNFGGTGTVIRMLTANTTFSRITGGQDGEQLTLILQQDGTGSRTATFPAAVVWVGGAAPTLPTGAYDAVIIHFYKVGTAYFGVTVASQVAVAANAAAHLALAAAL
jgi:hypothetical protein